MLTMLMIPVISMVTVVVGVAVLAIVAQLLAW